METFVREYPKQISDSVCDDLIDFFHEKKQMQDPTGESFVQHINEDYRKDFSLNCQLFGTFKRKFQTYLDSEIHDAFQDYRSEMGRCWPKVYDNVHYKLQYASPGGGFLSWHSDGGVEDLDRFLTWIIYLNDVDKGGRTEFRYQGEELKKGIVPEKGKLVLFPAARTHIHRAAPDLEQDKYILTGWFTWRKP